MAAAATLEAGTPALVSSQLNTSLIKVRTGVDAGTEQLAPAVTGVDEAVVLGAGAQAPSVTAAASALDARRRPDRVRVGEKRGKAMCINRRDGASAQGADRH
ncbi:MAG: hypothetical protein R2704_03765 [Microthrixaceae bacterium]